MLLNKSGMTLLSGVLSLAAYWGWIFSTFSSVVINPFGSARITDYLALLVIAAGSSALCMFVTALAPDQAERFFRGTGGTVMLALLSPLGCIPALLSNVGFDVSFAQTLLPWVVSTFVSSLIFLKTGAFFVWLKRAKLSRCIALSFLLAALLYVLSLLLAPLVGVLLVMTLPVVSCICTLTADRYMARTHPPSTPEGHAAVERRRETFGSRIAELRHFAPLTLIYTVSFGIVSHVVLYLAFIHDLVIVIAVSILVASSFAAIGSFVFRAQFEAERTRRLLLPLIAVALLPFPYLSPVMQVVFLSVAVFGFTCFDAVGWGDLADEVRDRNLKLFGYLSAASTINFAGIFVGWGMGYVLFALSGENDYATGFGIVSIVLVIALILNLALGGAGESEVGGVASATEFHDTWKERCLNVAQAHALTKQEERVFIMLARGRNYRHVAEELYVSIHTVKTHVYHIYKKLGIHSQQELIDMVEAEL
jgi:DNA-binding CsgD family transcriptional regulator